MKRLLLAGVLIAPLALARAERAAVEAEAAVGERRVDMHMEVHARAEALDRVELRRGRSFRSLRSFSIKRGQRPRQDRVDLAAARGSRWTK